MKTIEESRNIIQEIEELFNHAQESFECLVKAIDRKDQIEINRLSKELKTALNNARALRQNNTSISLNGRHIYLCDVITNYLDIIRVMLEAESEDINDLALHILNADPNYSLIYRRVFEKKAFGPYAFNVEDCKKTTEERKRLLNIDTFIEDLITLATKTLTKTDILPDYYNMYQIPGNINHKSLIASNGISYMIRLCNGINLDDAVIVEDNYRYSFDGKEYQISLPQEPLISNIQITCSDGRRLGIEVHLEEGRQPDDDSKWRSVPVYITRINLFYPIGNNKSLMCTAKGENNDCYDTDYAGILENVCSPTLDGTPIDWRYFAFHKDKYIQNEELMRICRDLEGFLEEMTYPNAERRLRAYQKMLDAKRD